NGNNVTLSAEGTTKGFTTTKVQVDALWGYMSDATPVDYDKDDEIDYYEAKLSDGKATMAVKGGFNAKEFDATMDSNDWKWEPLPLDGTLQLTYVNPKLTYAVDEVVDMVYDEDLDEYID
ncbi:MAG: hypothetical protein IJ485_07575, partial [Lachnospiraceae bacterium]|nr:hypothetical protein [Lachnospiraceae bacterium]